MRTYNLHVLLGNTGLRRSELLKLSLAQIDLEKREISVIRKTTKTDAGKRFIPLNTHAMIAAMTLIELAKAKGATKPEHFLFPLIFTGVPIQKKPATIPTSTRRRSAPLGGTSHGSAV